MAISVAVTGNSGITVSRSASVTFSGYTPATNDVVVLFAASGNPSAAVTDPSGWTNPLGSNTMVTSDSNTQVCVCRPVTSGEVSAATTTYAATNLWNATQTGNVVGVVLRGVDSATPVDSAAAAFDSGDTATPHTLPGLAGANLSTNSLVVAAIAKDGGGAYTVPSGWTSRTASSSNFAQVCYTRNALTTSGTNVAATSITPNAGDEFCSITVAFTEGAGAAYTPSATDLVGSTDAAGVTQDWARSPADLIGAADSLTLGAVKTASDPVGVTDSVVVATQLAASAADGVGVTDSLTLLTDRAAADAVGLADSAAVTLGAAPTVTDPLDVGDNASTAQGFDRPQTDGVGVGDSFTQDVARTRTDPVGVTDSFGSEVSTGSTDPVGAADVLAIIADYQRSWTDPAGVADSATFVIVAAAASVDPIGVSDGLAVAHTVVFTDTVGVGDALSLGFGRVFTDSADLTDDLTADYVRAFTDPLGVGDAATFQLSDNVIRPVNPVGIGDTAVFAAFTAPGDGNTWTVRTESTAFTATSEDNRVSVTESAICAANAETRTHAVTAESNRMEVS